MCGRDREIGHDVNDRVDEQRRQEEEEAGEDGRQRKQRPGEGGVQDQPAASDHGTRALADRRADEAKREQGQEEVREADHAAAPATDDLDEREVDEAEEQRVEDEPNLAERRVEVLAAQVGPGELECELPPAPELAKIGLERREADLVRLVDVMLGRKLARPMWIGDRGHRVQVSRCLSRSVMSTLSSGDRMRGSRARGRRPRQGRRRRAARRGRGWRRGCPARHPRLRRRERGGTPRWR